MPAIVITPDHTAQSLAFEVESKSIMTAKQSLDKIESLLSRYPKMENVKLFYSERSVFVGIIKKNSMGYFSGLYVMGRAIKIKDDCYLLDDEQMVIDSLNQRIDDHTIRAAGHTLSKGDVMVSTLISESTSKHYYQVIDTTKRQAKLRQINEDVRFDNNDGMTGLSFPILNDFKSTEIITVVVDGLNNAVTPLGGAKPAKYKIVNDQKVYCASHWSAYG